MRNSVNSTVYHRDARVGTLMTRGVCLGLGPGGGRLDISRHPSKQKTKKLKTSMVTSLRCDSLAKNRSLLSTPYTNRNHAKCPKTWCGPCRLMIGPIAISDGGSVTTEIRIRMTLHRHGHGVPNGWPSLPHSVRECLACQRPIRACRTRKPRWLKPQDRCFRRARPGTARHRNGRARKNPPA